ncbi:hypothetical protein [Nostoc sp. PCC 7524]|uniref:hypothetical protein n=1 Tax=Nostoc sp. (strain ATCC 29411 / PCC 7524) TaxID=28072 RepID=UPI000A86AE18|nr:hypothetical protein [Nostoc sp. PCC 7524]
MIQDLRKCDHFLGHDSGGGVLLKYTNKVWYHDYEQISARKTRARKALAVTGRESQDT